MTQPRMPQLQGNPIWFALATPDPAGAKSFYTGLFGWEWADVPMSGGDTYHMAIRGDANIAGMSADNHAEGVAGVWINSVYVEDAEEIVKRVQANGGRVLSGPHNADGWGVTATVATPEGAVFGLWQSLMGYGADIFAELGAVCWIEYHTGDLEAAKRFYSEAFGADFDTITMPMDDDAGSDYKVTMLSIDGEQMPCALFALTGDESTARWATYFMVEDIHSSVARAESLGAKVVFPVMDVPPGSLASLTDPQGVRFSLWQPAV
ncbi:MAG: VOC family protein [Chloroflexi bacterium]|nr:VOC family protein [Chloroflexota bacterium]